MTAGSRPFAAPSVARRVDPRLVFALGALYLLWGSTYLAMRVAVEALPPLSMAGSRFVVAGAALLGFVRVRDGVWPSRRTWLLAVPLGALFFLFGNGLVVVAEETLPSSLAAVVCATTPLIAAALGALRGDRPRRAEVIGMLLGVFGVARILAIGSPLAHAGLRGLLIVLAPVAWATGSLVSRAQKTHTKSGLPDAGAQMLFGGIWLLLASALFHETMPGFVPWRCVVAWTWLVSMGSLVGFSAYTWLLRHARPATAMSYAYVNPVVAALLGAALGGEHLGWPMACATALIAAGVTAAVAKRG